MERWVHLIRELFKLRLLELRGDLLRYRVGLLVQPRRRRLAVVRSSVGRVGRPCVHWQVPRQESVEVFWRDLSVGAEELEEIVSSVMTAWSQN